MPQRNFLILVIAAAVAAVCLGVGEQNPHARFAARGLAEIADGALEPVPSERLYQGAMEGMIAVLREHGDPHSQFISSDQADPFRDGMRQQFGGIGVRIRITGQPPQPVIVGRPEPGMPADLAGVREADRILAVDGRPTDSMTLGQLLRAVRGPPGEAVELQLQHADAEQPRTLRIVRQTITVDSILGDRRGPDGRWRFRLEDDPRIAHVRIATFANRTAEELAGTLERLVDEGVQAVALDLRDDAGGALDAAVEVCDMLLPAGRMIAEVRGRNGVLHQRYETTGEGRFTELPLAVLVNANSASASEIVAACLQDHQRATVVGSQTFGKGTVQQLIPTEAGRSLLKLTWAAYRRPSGERIHRTPHAVHWGVSPDAGYEVPLTEAQIADWERYRRQRDLSYGPADRADPGHKPADPQLARAVEHLQHVLDRAAAR